ncbi:hypothetical protein [Skermanella pratensis]|uniref:hypothetical protein n=1 Tax=Skermanella pratensis TaxID=2233999 RepID=UPI0017885A19|nr:hypothetical protein [Skermanella pratensis]
MALPGPDAADAVLVALAAGEDDTLGGLIAYRPFAPDPPGRTIAPAWRAQPLNAPPPRPLGLLAPPR